MPGFANVLPSSLSDGVFYANQAALPAAEADVFNQGPVQSSPMVNDFDQALQAEVLFTAQGPLASNTSYVVLQMDFGDNNWFDVAWCTFQGLSGTGLFYLSAGAFVNNVFQQTRAVGSPPSPPNGTNNCQLAGRFRFVGKTSLGSSSSSSSGQPGQPAQVLVTIKYKKLGLR
jgi:hypothetical protein